MELRQPSQKSSTRAQLHRGVQTIVATLTSLLVAACGGGSGDGGSLGGEQSPDPVVVDFPIVYVERSLPVDEDGNLLEEDIVEPNAFKPGAQLMLRPRASEDAPVTILTQGLFAEDEQYDIKDVDVSSDGNKVVFALRAPDIEDVDDDEQPTWNIWEYDVELNQLRRIISSDINAEAGEDVSPHYLPDGRIVFSSTRQRRSRAILLDENKPQYAAQDEDRDNDAFLLHVMEEDGSNIQQLSFNQSHDLYPTVLSDGRILFLRWDNVANRSNLSLYTINPDGSNLSLFYGHNSQATGTDDSVATFWQPHQLPDGRILISLKPRSNTSYGGDMVAIDGANASDRDFPVAGAGQESLAALAVRTDESASPHGVFSSVYPLFDGTDRALVSWSQCRLQNPDDLTIVSCSDSNLADSSLQVAPPLFGLWMYDFIAATQQPVIVPREGIMVTEAAVLAPRPAAAFIPDPVTGVDNDSDLVEQGVGVLHIRSVYDVDGVDLAPGGITATSDPVTTPPDLRPARFLRLYKPVSMPDDDTLDFDGSAFGRSRSQLMREIIGYVPIEPDGSTMVQVPADIAFSIEVLDANGRRISARHNNWLQLRPGEERECSGCHDTNNSISPHGRPDMEPASANAGAPTTGQPFPNTEPALFADMGETMAQTYARINGIRTPTVDIVFADEWTDPAVTAKSASFDYSYADLSSSAPATAACQTQWQSLCRTVINYADHIQPIWDADRRQLDNLGNLIGDQTCTSCHGDNDAMSNLQIPAAQLDLVGTASPEEANHLVSYRELMFSDNEQEIIEGVLLDRLIQATDGQGNPLFELDENGEQLLDIDGNPIPVLVTIGVAPSMSTAGANASPRFFNVFATGGSHDGYLNNAELKLISEWLDLGGQYYNNPFDAPAN